MTMKPEEALSEQAREIAEGVMARKPGWLRDEMAVELRLLAQAHLSLARQLTEAERQGQLWLEGLQEQSALRHLTEQLAERYREALERIARQPVPAPGQMIELEQSSESIAQQALNTGESPDSPPKDSAGPSATGSEGEA